MQLSEKELNQVGFGSDNSYVDKNEHIKKNFTANFESLTQTVDSEILNEEKEGFRKFLQSYCDLFSENVYFIKTTLIQIWNGLLKMIL